MINVKGALIKNSVAAVASRVSAAVFRLFNVPLLLSFLGTEGYGTWLVISSLPSWLSMANMGVGNVAGNGISIAVAKGNFKEANSIYSTTLAVLFIVLFSGTALLLVAVIVLPLAKWLNLSGYDEREISWAIFLLGFSTLLAMFNQALGAKVRAARKAHLSMLLDSTLPWVQFGATWLTLLYSRSFIALSWSILATTVVFVFCNFLLASRFLREVTFSYASINRAELSDLTRKGFAFQAFPLGNALVFQGNLLVISLVLGPVAVAIFGTARTLTRSVNQLLEMINQSIWPELTHLLGAGELVKAARLHRLSVGLAVCAGCSGALVLWMAGPWIFIHWTRNAIALPSHLLALFLIPLPFCTLWFTSSVVHSASNQHEGLAWRYLVASALSVVACYGLAKVFGLEGAVVATALLDIILAPYVIRRSIKLTGDSPRAFAAGVLVELRALLQMIPGFPKPV